jgi:hypothetical protein
MLLAKEKRRKETQRQPRSASSLQAAVRRRHENRMQRRAHREPFLDESQLADLSFVQRAFKNQNKDFGAYTSHPSYSRNLMIWLIVTGIAVAIAIGYPVFSKLSGRGQIAPKALVKTLVQTELPPQPSLP